MKEQVYKLFKNVCLFLLILFVLDRGLGGLLQHYLFTEKNGDSYVTRRAVTEMKEDIVIIGSSRAQHHYIPALITKKTGLSCYNIGRDGMRMLYYEAVFKSMLNYHTPKIIILDLTAIDFEHEEEEQQIVTSAILPFSNKNRALEDHIYAYNRIEYYKAKISVLYRLNSYPLSILQHHIGIGNKIFNGYEPLEGSDVKISKTSLWNNTDYKESKFKVRAFENIVRTSKAKNIKLYVVVSPALQIPKFNAIKSANIILQQYGMKCYSYADFFDIRHKNLFRDPGHLNNEGAEVFTDQIISDILLKKYRPSELQLPH